MTRTEIAALENVGRASMVWSPEGRDGRTHYASVAAAMVTALPILLVAAAFLFHLI